MLPYFHFFLSLLLIGCLPLRVMAQEKPVYGTGEIVQLLDQVQVLGNVLYLAAHPDDENTRLISWLANEKHYRTGYLSLTRGDGGQNLIGSEIRERLGIIRTQELLGARRIDGGEQFFTRANDFGYSKHPNETFRIWNHDSILYDVVKVIRQFKPDVIITRFNVAPGTTHGHHTASAILAKEAFRLAGDPNVFPDQLKELTVWQPKRLYWNTSSWFYARNGLDFDSTRYLGVDVGGYNPLLGKSYNEIAAEARSMHLSQGFGTSRQRGETMEFLEVWEGNPRPSSIFDGIPTDWSRVKGGAKVGVLLQQAAEQFNPHQPEVIVPTLLKAFQLVDKLPENPFKKQKIKELKKLIVACSGLYLDVFTTTQTVAQGEAIQLTTELVNRSGLKIVLEEAVLENFENVSLQAPAPLPVNTVISAATQFNQTKQLPISQPYWLSNKGTLGHFHFPDSLIGLAENEPALTASFRLRFNDQSIRLRVPVRYKQVSPATGERYQPLYITPEIMVNVGSDLLLFHEQTPKEVMVTVVAGKDAVSGTLRLNLAGEGWSVDKPERAFEIARNGESKSFSFIVRPPKETSSLQAQAEIISDAGRQFNRGIETIAYSHLPNQVFFPKADVNLVRINMRSTAHKVLYIRGAGDILPEALAQVGYQVQETDAETLTAAQLSWADAAVLGVRAFNTQPALAYKNQLLEDFARAGGVVLIQYNTNFRLVTDKLTPFSLTLSNQRVTEENAEIHVLAPDHPALTSPNLITSADFDNWVQERGLYFPSAWDNAWTPLLSSHDQGEQPLNGGLLVAKVGQGYYVYSGYSWFRQLPAGVPGAYRLLANLLSLSSANP